VTQSQANIVQRRINQSEAARQLGVSIRGIRKLIASGDLKTVTMPVRTQNVILQSSVDEILARAEANNGRQAS
jgi:hypothetical protein